MLQKSASQRGSEELLHQLRGAALFSAISDPEAKLLLQTARRATIRAGQELITEGEFGTSMFWLMSGSVDVLQATFEGNSRLLATRGAGSVIGELALIDDRPRSATVVAREPCRVLVLQQRQLREIVRRNPDLAFSLMKSLAALIRDQNDRLSMPTDSRSRVLQFIANSLRDQDRSDDPVVSVVLGANFADLAPRLSMTRETLSRIVSELQAAKILRRDGRRAILLNKKRFWMAYEEVLN